MANFSEYILWTQSFSTTGEDILLVDGNKLSSAEGEEYFSYMSLMSNDIDPKWKPLFENDINYHDKSKIALSRSFSIYQNSEGCTLVKSLFLDQDETGRKIAYLFCCHTLNLKDVIIILMNVAVSVNRSLNTSDLSMIATLRYKKCIPYIGLLVIFVISLIVFVLWTMLK